MNTFEMFVIQGELACGAVNGIHRNIMNCRHEFWHGTNYYREACDILTCIRQFLKNELTLFIESLELTAECRLLSAQLTACAVSLDERLDDIVMLHVDEPDGAFASAMETILKLFEQLVGLMRDCLPGLSGLADRTVDVRHLQVIMRNAA